MARKKNSTISTLWINDILGIVKFENLTQSANFELSQRCSQIQWKQNLQST